MVKQDQKHLSAAVAQAIALLEDNGARRFALYPQWWDGVAQPSFGDLLDQLEAMGWVVNDELAVRVALTTLAPTSRRMHQPPDLIQEILVLLREPSHHDPRGKVAQHRRAEEFALHALLTGPNTGPWRPLVSGAHQVFKCFVYRHVDRCLSCLCQMNRQTGVPGLPTLQARHFVVTVVARYLDNPPCTCWAALAAANPTRLRGQARIKRDACKRNHALAAWQPGRLVGTTRSLDTLWSHAERAAKGFAGPFRHEGFPSGILCAVLANQGYILKRCKVVCRWCPACGTAAAATEPAEQAQTAGKAGWTVRMQCQHGCYADRPGRLRRKKWLVLHDRRDRPQEGFLREQVRRCSAGHIYFAREGQCPVEECSSRERSGSKDTEGLGYFML